MTDQVESPLMDLLLEINEHRKNLATQENQQRGSDVPGIGLVELSAGDQRRVFNEGIKNYGDKGKEIHDKFNNTLLGEVAGSVELENLAKGLTFPVTAETLDKVNTVFEKIDAGLTQDPRWDQFWKDQQKAHGSMTDTELDKIKETILSGYRFKVIQMVGFNVAKEKPAVLNNYSSLMQAMNGVRVKQAVGDIDPNIALSQAVALHVSQAEYNNKITHQDYLSHIEGKLNAMPNDKKILPIFGEAIANQAFKQAIESKSKDKDFFHKSIAQAIKNNNGEEVEKLNKELTRLTGKPLTAVDILTNPIYFETVPYQKLAERSDKEFHIAENTDFAKFYHDFKDGKLIGKSDEEIKTTIKEFLEGSGEAFSEGAKSEINISDLDKHAIEKALQKVNTEGKLDRDNLKKALDPAYTQVQGMLVADENLKKVDMKATLNLPTPKVSSDVAKSHSDVPSVVQTRNMNARIQRVAPQVEITFPQRLGKAITAFFKNGLSIKAARTAFAEGLAPQLPKSIPQPLSVTNKEQPLQIDSGLKNSLSGLLGTPSDSLSNKKVSDSEQVLGVRSVPPYTPTISAEKLAQDTPDKLKSNMLNFLSNFEAKGKELDHIQQQVGQAVTQIASGAEPKNVIQSLERSIEVTKEEFGVKNPESIKALNTLENKLGEFKGRVGKLEVAPSEPKQTSTPTVSKRSM